MRIETLIDGSIRMIGRAGESPPSCPPSFVPDPNDPWVFRPKFCPCPKRRFKYKKMPCGAIAGLWVCDAKSEETVTINICDRCDLGHKTQ